MIFKDSKWYQVCKWVVTVVLPAITTLWLAIAGIWNLPYAEPIGATLSAITVFFAALLGVGSIKYQRQISAYIDGGEEDG